MSDSHPIPTDRAMATAHEFLLSVAMEDSGKVKITSDDIAPFFQGLLTESERAIGILAFAFVESRLFELFSQRLDSSIHGGVESILGPQGILDSVGAQIRMLRSLRWLRAETEQDLRLLARIRNRFAHAHTALTFEDSKIRGYFSALTKHEERCSKFFQGGVLKIQETYLVRVAATLYFLYADLTLMPSSLRAGLGPTGAFAAGFDKYPSDLRNALANCMSAVELIYEKAGSVQPPTEPA
jgi:DNA-binding MltR family transcriptional regulator